MPIDVTSEILTRYIFNRSQYSAEKQRVKYSAFMPPSNRRLSVFHISNLGENEIWAIGDMAGMNREIPVLARADIEGLLVAGIGLAIETDEITPRHANIIGWPEEFSEVKLKAIELSEKARLRIK